MSYNDPMSINYDPSRCTEENAKAHGYNKYRTDGISVYESGNHYRSMNAWLLQKGFRIKTQKMKKFQKITKIIGEKFSPTRIIKLEPEGKFNNLAQVKVSMMEEINVKYKKLKTNKMGDKWAKFKF